MAATVTTPRLMVVGGGALAELPAILQRLGLSRPLVVTDPYIAGCGILDRATGLLDGARIRWSVFSDTVPDPTTAIVETGTLILAEGGFDSLVAIGGGSSIDTAKAMSVLAASGGAMRDYKVPVEIPKAGPPLIAIPTTAGTGSEVTRFTVITDTETDEKMLIAGLACCPLAALVDYELTLSMPLRLTADTGLDSLTHAIEAYVSRRAHPFTDGLAKNAMSLIARHIRTACAEPGNRAAREAMMLGATTAGMAFSNSSVCLVHGMSRPIGTRALRRLRSRDGGGGGGRREPGRGRAAARRAAAAQRRSPGPDAACLGHRCRTLRGAAAADGEPGAGLGLARQQSAGPDERGDHRALSPCLWVTAD